MVTTTADVCSGISADRVYPLPVFKTLAGLGDHALRTARRNGLKVTYAGRRGFVRGSDWLEYLATLAGGGDDD